jgi:hypothetical protein
MLRSRAGQRPMVLIVVGSRSASIALPSGPKAAVIALVWPPAIVLATGLLRLVPTFDRWPWELPTLTKALMSIGRLGFWPVLVAGVGFTAVLAGLGAGRVRAGLPGRRAVVFAIATARTR